MSTILVAACALAIAIIGCAVVDPTKGLSNPPKSEHRD